MSSSSTISTSPSSPQVEVKEDKKSAKQPAKLTCLSVVIPVYNEAFTFKHLLSKVQSVPLPMEIIIVDDFSTDGTRQLLGEIEQEARQKNQNIKVVLHEKNKGKGAAVRTGIKHATGDLLIIQDADMEYNPNEYPKLIEPILSGDADVVYGSRFRGERRKVLLFWHTVGNMFLTLMSNLFTNLNLSDMETCYKVFKTEIIKNMPLRSNRFGFEPEVTAKIAKLRCRIYEVPISYQGRSYAEGKKINWKDGVSAIYTILKFWIIDDLYEETAGLRTLRIMEGAGKYNQWLYEQAKPYLGDRVLEMGSGVGNITKYLLMKKKVIATDIVPFYLQELKRSFSHFSHVAVQKFDLLRRDTAKEIKNEHAPDTVISMNVLEHIEDDAEALQNVNRVLPMGGKFAIIVPAHMALFSKMDTHLGHFRRYNKKMLKERLEKAGFEVESTKYLNFLGALGWYVNGRILRKKLLPSRQVRAFDFVVKMLALEKWISPPFGLSVMAFAKKVK